MVKRIAMILGGGNSQLWDGLCPTSVTGKVTSSEDGEL